MAAKALHVRMSEDEEKMVDLLVEETGIKRADLVRHALRRLAASYGIVPERESFEYGDPDEKNGKEAAMFLKNAESGLCSTIVDIQRARYRLEKKS